MKIHISPYNPQWKKQFEQLQKILWSIVKDNALAIEHVGSTSIPGLSAKPIIDLDIIIPNNEQTKQTVIKQLVKLGYSHLGNLGITGREAFKRNSAKTPITDKNKDWFAHNLYFCEKGSIGLQNHLALKNIY